MLESLTNWFSWTTKEEWKTWEYWQRSQGKKHYERSQIYQNYVFLKPLGFSVGKRYDNKYYDYCFGDFSNFIIDVSEENKGEKLFINYCLNLLDFYDTSKGITRKITGDPPGILVLRETVNMRTIAPLHSHNFKQYMYDYSLIHAHTVAQYSLSTLIMILISDYMSKFSNSENYSQIVSSECEKAYNEGRFGDHKAITNYFRCNKCNRICENLWGNFNLCLDCHMKRVCSKCSVSAVVIGLDDLPKCSQHM